MQTVKHKIFGIGEVIGREVKDHSTYIAVRFESGKESRFAIPESFTLGIISAEGDFENEVDAIIAETKERDRARAAERRAEYMVTSTATPSCRRGRTPITPAITKGSIESAFKEYLANAGYKEYTDSGNPSTVFSYTHAIKKVLEEEGDSWHTLQSNIKNIVHVYDIGGSKQYIGAKSNYTVINALKRFDEFVNG